MYITAHATIGILIGERVGNPMIGFLLGVFAHFICDIIPHGDTQFDAWADRAFTNRKPVTYIIASLDYAAMITMLFFIAPSLTLTPSVVAATIGTIIPDMFWAWYEISYWKILAAYTQFHNKLHKVLPIDVPYWLGLLYQVLLVIVLVNVH